MNVKTHFCGWARVRCGGAGGGCDGNGERVDGGTDQVRATNSSTRVLVKKKNNKTMFKENVMNLNGCCRFLYFFMIYDAR